MLKAVMLQVSLVLVMTGVALYAGGWMAGASALLGGLSYSVPSMLFAMRLGRLARPGAPGQVSYAFEFFLGEAIKVASTIGLLVLWHFLVPGLSWGWLLAGLAAALQAGFFAFLFKH
ncbi:MAG: ATP synthase subunit I [Gammaproteobacteria bacterium]|jgi:ATP synthase protein I|nr:ATP synthase subunit I [Gammaproteobacteria bacterium]MBU0770011.1 ATP synthase subunit I [Gammaproteobacteria bacterium]MBU0856141.1 ATP synthase subunit I [Gammaproteobacteria bacterium]MBU1848032.1 ATP synthase subunit I [Gammaproteobacteria bacterium]